jgi:hypothetical protein
MMGLPGWALAAMTMLAIPAVADTEAVPWSALLLEKTYAPALDQYKATTWRWSGVTRSVI